MQWSPALGENPLYSAFRFWAGGHARGLGSLHLEWGSLRLAAGLARDGSRARATKGFNIQDPTHIAMNARSIGTDQWHRWSFSILGGASISRRAPQS
eukprot:5452698-Prymnesium_polylepis.1